MIINTANYPKCAVNINLRWNAVRCQAWDRKGSDGNWLYFKSPLPPQSTAFKQKGSESMIKARRTRYFCKEKCKITKKKFSRSMFLKIFFCTGIPVTLVKNADYNSVGLARAWNSAVFNKISIEDDDAGLQTTLTMKNILFSSKVQVGLVSVLACIPLLIFLAITYLDGINYIKHHWEFK